MPTDSICGPGGESVSQPQGPRGRLQDIRLNIERPILADQTNALTSGSFVPIVAKVNQRTPGPTPSRLSKKNLKRAAGIGGAIPCSPQTIEQLQIPYKKARKDTTHGGLAPENYNQVIQAVINPQIVQHGAVRADTNHQVIGEVDVHVSASPTETVTVQPDGTIQHAHGDPQCASLAGLNDWAGLDDVLGSSWDSSLLEHIDFTPSLWVDAPATSVEATTSAEPVQHHQSADPASGSLHTIQDPIHNPPCIVSPIAHEVAGSQLPAGPAIASAEYLAAVRDSKLRKEFADKLAVLAATVTVNSLAIGRQSKRGDDRYQALEEQTKQSFIAIREENARDRMTDVVPNAETSNGRAIVVLQRKHSAVEAAVRGNTQDIARISSEALLRASKTRRKLWLLGSASEANVNSNRAMCTEMGVMNDTLAKLTVNANI
ncbi:uncharacterized protein LOC130380016 [Gadus chalcogrammus]|uniref:uncharacterized protein LOC130380016 n=1 Tax=Gadus chalcogrammus TaxID=1042646 RepID=UPI0024C39E3D|nr:uncharacterized protein LOC130380016 [Gadus chalcogrammus]